MTTNKVYDIYIDYVLIDAKRCEATNKLITNQAKNVYNYLKCSNAKRKPLVKSTTIKSL